MTAVARIARRTLVQSGLGYPTLLAMSSEARDDLEERLFDLPEAASSRPTLPRKSQSAYVLHRHRYPLFDPTGQEGHWHRRISSGTSAAAAIRRIHSHPQQQQEQLGQVGEGGNELCGHQHYSNRAPWLRALVLGANDGLVSVASLIMGVGAGSSDHTTLILSGTAGVVAGSLSMAVGEYISVSSQRDAEQADIERERQEQLKGPEAQVTWCNSAAAPPLRQTESMSSAGPGCAAACPPIGAQQLVRPGRCRGTRQPSCCEGSAP